MSTSSQQELTPSSEDAIKNPANPNHFMVIEPVDGRVRVFLDGRLIADTEAALRVREVGRKVYDPVLYLPLDALTVQLEQTEKTSHCPLKGDAVYHALDGEEVGWSYPTPLDFAEALTGHHAFWTAKVRIEQSPRLSA